MKRKQVPSYLRGLVWFTGAVLCLASLVGAPIIHSLIPMDSGSSRQMKLLKQDLAHLGLSKNIDNEAIKDLSEYRRVTGKPLGQILREPAWLAKFGLQSTTFKVTWYIANPYDLLPADLKIAIKNNKKPFRTQAQVWDWVRSQKGPDHWKKALKAALVETTPINLWRASRGEKPFVKNGEILKPLVIEHSDDSYEVRDGHIATDPRIIPTNTELLLIVRINGRDRVLKVKAADIGGGIKGKHVDLPIQLHPSRRMVPTIVLPKSKIGNPTVQILMPVKQATPNRKV